jgi:hypothetical protein
MLPLCRYEFFNAEREFVRCLTDISEELRFVENREARGPLLEQRLQVCTHTRYCYTLLRYNNCYCTHMHIATSNAKLLHSEACRHFMIVSGVCTTCML